MKKLRRLSSLTLCLAALMSMTLTCVHAAGGKAYVSTQAVEVDGKKIEFQMYALRDANGNDTNYVKLRDVAHVLNGTPARFSVGYDNASGTITVTSGQSYTDAGTEMTTPYSGDRAYQTGSGAVLVDGRTANLDAIVLTDDQGGDYTYFKLRDLADALNFSVDWSAQRGVIVSTGSTTGALDNDKTTTTSGTTGVLTNGKPVTEENVLEILAEIEKEYPTGTPWGDYGPNYNKNKVSATMTSMLNGSHKTSTAWGCGGFATMVSDMVFGYEAPARKLDDISEIRPGDIIVLVKNGQTIHVEVAMSRPVNAANVVRVAEGNCNDQVIWPSSDDPNFDIPGNANNTWAVYTRYPD